jgi:hypothetical protein
MGIFQLEIVFGACWVKLVAEKQLNRENRVFGHN